MAQGGTGLTQTVYAILRQAAAAENPLAQPNRANLIAAETGPSTDRIAMFLNPPEDAEQGRDELVELAPDGTAILKMTCSSAIVAAPGPDTGEMLVAYPQTTAHSIEVAPEEMKMQMRAYLGAAIYNDANVIRVPHVHCEHAESMRLDDFQREMQGRGGDDFVRDEAKRGNFLFLNQSQFTLAMQRMDLAPSINLSQQAPAQPSEVGRGRQGTVTSTRGKFSADGGAAAPAATEAADGGAAAPAATEAAVGGGSKPAEAGAAEVEHDGASTKSKKKKGARL